MDLENENDGKMQEIRIRCSSKFPVFLLMFLLFFGNLFCKRLWKIVSDGSNELSKMGSLGRERFRGPSPAENGGIYRGEIDYALF